MIKATTPICCYYAKRFITLRYETYYSESKTHFLKTKPFWIVRGSGREDAMFIAEMTELRIFFCPNCGAKLPKIKLKDKLPEKVLVITDGGYYCNTCHERLNECQCTPPERMWEII